MPCSANMASTAASRVEAGKWEIKSAETLAAPMVQIFQAVCALLQQFKALCVQQQISRWFTIHVPVRAPEVMPHSWAHEVTNNMRDSSVRV